MNSDTKVKEEKRIRRHRRIRSQVHGSAERPRLAVFRSNRFLAAQAINDDEGTTLVGLSTREIADKGTKTEQAQKLGKKMAEALKEKGVAKIVFDRGGYLYMGNIKAFADSVREGGLEF